MIKYFIIFLLILSVNVSHQSFSQWVQCSNGIGANQKITSIISCGSYLYAGSSTGGVYRSSDYGDNWQAVNTGLGNLSVSTLYYSNNKIFAGTFGSGVYISTDSGGSWSNASGGLSNFYINCFYYFGNKIYAGTSDTLGNSGGVYVTTNSGANWSFTGLTGLSVKAFTSCNNYLLAGTEYNGTTGGIFRTTNGGLNWAISNYGLLGFGIEVNALSADGANIYAGTGTGVYLSANNGSQWESISIQLSNVRITTLAFFNFMFFAGSPGGVYISTNYGVNWRSKNEGLPSDSYINTLYCTDAKLFAGVSGQSVWRRDANEIINIRKISEEIPTKFGLEQNYPNPFNPSTKIRFHITNKSNVRIIIYDVQGKELMEAISATYSAGTNEYEFNGINYPSGIYYCRLTADNKTETIKMVLIK